MTVKLRDYSTMIRYFYVVALLGIVLPNLLIANEASVEARDSDEIPPPLGVVLNIEKLQDSSYQMGTKMSAGYSYGIDDPTFGGTLSLRAAAGRLVLRRKSNRQEVFLYTFQDTFDGAGPPAGFRGSETTFPLSVRLEPDDYEVLVSLHGVKTDGTEMPLARKCQSFRIECIANASTLVSELNAKLATMRKGDAADAVIHSSLNKIVLTDEVIRSISWPKTLKSLDLSNASHLHAGSIEHISKAINVDSLILDGLQLSGADLAPLIRMEKLTTLSVVGVRFVTDEDNEVFDTLVQNGVEVRR